MASWILHDIARLGAKQQRHFDSMMMSCSFVRFLPAVQPPHAAQQILVEAGNQVAVAVFVFSKFSAHRKALGCRGVARVQRAFQPKGERSSQQQIEDNTTKHGVP